MAVVTRAEFARLQGYDKAYVTRLAKEGRLVLTAEGRVDVDQSRKRLEETADPRRQDVAERHARERAAKAAAAAVQAPETAGPDPDPDEPDKAMAAPASDPVTASFQASRATKERFNALQAQLDYERAAGKLVETREVERAGRELGTLLRQTLERIADVLAPELAPETDVDRVHSLISASIEEALRSVSDRAKMLARRMEGGGQ